MQRWALPQTLPQTANAAICGGYIPFADLCLIYLVQICGCGTKNRGIPQMQTKYDQDRQKLRQFTLRIITQKGIWYGFKALGELGMIMELVCL